MERKDDDGRPTAKGTTTTTTATTTATSTTDTTKTTTIIHFNWNYHCWAKCN